MKPTKAKRISKRVQDGPNTTVPIRKGAHKDAKIACAHSGATLVEFVSDAVTKAARSVSA